MLNFLKGNRRPPTKSKVQMRVSAWYSLRLDGTDSFGDSYFYVERFWLKIAYLHIRRACTESGVTVLPDRN